MVQRPLKFRYQTTRCFTPYDTNREGLRHTFFISLYYNFTPLQTPALRYSVKLSSHPFTLSLLTFEPLWCTVHLQIGAIRGQLFLLVQKP